MRYSGFEEMNRIMREKYPFENNYCSVIALAAITGMRLSKARAALYRISNRVEGKGTTVLGLIKTLEALGYTVRTTTVSEKTTLTMHRSKRQEKMFVIVPRHVAAYVPGIGIVDWSRERVLRISRAYIVTKN